MWLDGGENISHSALFFSLKHTLSTWHHCFGKVQLSEIKFMSTEGTGNQGVGVRVPSGEVSKEKVRKAKHTSFI